MEKLLEALIFVTDYLNNRSPETDEEDDVAALEHVSACLAGLSREEFTILESMARRLGRMDWVEDMFPERGGEEEE